MLRVLMLRARVGSRGMSLQYIFADYDVERILNPGTKSSDAGFALYIVAYDAYTSYRQQDSKVFEIHVLLQSLFSTSCQRSRGMLMSQERARIPVSEETL